MPTSILLTPTQRQALINLLAEYKPQIDQGSLYLFYSGVSNYISTQMLDSLVVYSDNQVSQLNQTIEWLEGAALVNKGIGIYSYIIRNYTAIQAKLRVGSNIEAVSAMQEASNQVGRNLFDSLTKLTVPDTITAFPDLRKIGDEDASAIGKVIFKQLLGPDSSYADLNQTTAYTQNAAWSGVLLFSMLGGNEIPRLYQDTTQGGTSTTLDTIDDLRNTVYAINAFKGVFGEGLSGLFQALVDAYGVSFQDFIKVGLAIASISTPTLTVARVLTNSGLTSLLNGLGWSITDDTTTKLNNMYTDFKVLVPTLNLWATSLGVSIVDLATQLASGSLDASGTILDLMFNQGADSTAYSILKAYRKLGVSSLVNAISRITGESPSEGASILNKFTDPGLKVKVLSSMSVSDLIAQAQLDKNIAYALYKFSPVAILNNNWQNDAAFNQEWETISNGYLSSWLAYRSNMLVSLCDYPGVTGTVFYKDDNLPDIQSVTSESDALIRVYFNSTSVDDSNKKGRSVIFGQVDGSTPLSVKLKNANNTIYTGNQGSSIKLDEGLNVVQGGQGVDVVDISSSTGGNKVSGGAGDDWIGYSNANENSTSVVKNNSTGTGNTYDGGLGDDHINGSIYQDTYIYRPYDGFDTITTNGGGDILQLLSSVYSSPMGMIYSRQGYDLIILIDPQSSSGIRIKNWFDDTGLSQGALSEITTADGSTILKTTIETSALTVSANDGATLEGLNKYSSTLTGASNNIFNLGDKSDTVNVGSGVNIVNNHGGADVLNLYKVGSQTKLNYSGGNVTINMTSYSYGSLNYSLTSDGLALFAYGSSADSAYLSIKRRSTGYNQSNQYTVTINQAYGVKGILTYDADGSVTYKKEMNYANGYWELGKVFSNGDKLQEYHYSDGGFYKRSDNVDGSHLSSYSYSGGYEGYYNQYANGSWNSYNKYTGYAGFNDSTGLSISASTTSLTYGAALDLTNFQYTKTAVVTAQALGKNTVINASNAITLDFSQVAAFSQSSFYAYKQDGNIVIKDSAGGSITLQGWANRNGAQSLSLKLPNNSYITTDQLNYQIHPDQYEWRYPYTYSGADFVKVVDSLNPIFAKADAYYGNAFGYGSYAQYVWNSGLQYGSWSQAGNGDLISRREWGWSSGLFNSAYGTYDPRSCEWSDVRYKYWKNSQGNYEFAITSATAGIGGQTIYSWLNGASTVTSVAKTTEYSFSQTAQQFLVSSAVNELLLYSSKP